MSTIDYYAISAGKDASVPRGVIVWRLHRKPPLLPGHATDEAKHLIAL